MVDRIRSEPRSILNVLHRRPSIARVCNGRATPSVPQRDGLSLPQSGPADLPSAIARHLLSHRAVLLRSGQSAQRGHYVPAFGDEGPAEARVSWITRAGPWCEPHRLAPSTWRPLAWEAIAEPGPTATSADAGWVIGVYDGFAPRTLGIVSHARLLIMLHAGAVARRDSAGSSSPRGQSLRERSSLERSRSGIHSRRSTAAWQRNALRGQGPTPASVTAGSRCYLTALAPAERPGEGKPRLSHRCRSRPRRRSASRSSPPGCRECCRRRPRGTRPFGRESAATPS